MSGLDPKYWTRWKYFKEITLWFWWQDIKQYGLFILTGLMAIVAIIVGFFLSRKEKDDSQY